MTAAAAATVHRHLCLPCSAPKRLHWEPKFLCTMRTMFLEGCCSQDIPAMCWTSTEAPPWDAAGRTVKAESSRARRGEDPLGNICGRHWHQLKGYVGPGQQTICQDLLIRMFTHKTGLFITAPEVVSERSRDHQENDPRINQQEQEWIQQPEEPVSSTGTLCPFCHLS